jgi:hypothetical protein
VATKRILITGSRTWDDRDRMARILWYVYDEGAVLVSGNGPSGADSMAEEIWEGLGGTVERHPADWRKGRGAGTERNKAMVHLGADICLAFWDGESNGTRHCANYATLHGIPTTWFILGEDEDGDE